MNPRLLRPTSSTLDPAAAVYLNAVAQADGQQLEPAVRKAINDFVIGCKRDGIWDAIKASCILMGARTLSGALTPLKGGAPTNVSNNFVSGDYDRETGLLGNASNKTIDINRNNNADPQDNSHGAIWITAAPTSGFGILASGDGLGNAGGNVLQRNANTTVAFRNRTSSDTTATANPFTGFFGHSRSSSTGFDRRHGGTTTAVTAASVTPSGGGALSPRLFARSDGAAVSNPRIAFYSVGESLNLALLDARISALVTAIGAAI
jgi:hypothetical protein